VGPQALGHVGVVRVDGAGQRRILDQLGGDGDVRVLGVEPARGGRRPADAVPILQPVAAVVAVGAAAVGSAEPIRRTTTARFA